MHLTAPGRAKGDAAHRIETEEPFEVLGLLWPMEGSDPVEVDVVIEDLRAQILIPEEALPRLKEQFRPPTSHKGRSGKSAAARAGSLTQRSVESTDAGAAGVGLRPAPDSPPGNHSTGIDV